MKNIEIDYKQKFITLVMNTTHKPVRLQYKGIETDVCVHFNDNLVEDPDSIFSLYYYSTFDAPNAELVVDLDGNPVADGKKIIESSYQFRMIAPVSRVKITAVAIGLHCAQYTMTESVIFPDDNYADPNSIFLNAARETYY